MWHDLQYIQSDFPWPFEMHINHTSQLFFLFSCFNNKSTPIKFIKSSRGEGGREKGTCITKALASWMIISGLVCILTRAFADTSVWCSFHISGSHHPAPFSNSPLFQTFSWASPGAVQQMAGQGGAPDLRLPGGTLLLHGPWHQGFELLRGWDTSAISPTQELVSSHPSVYSPAGIPCSLLHVSEQKGCRRAKPLLPGPTAKLQQRSPSSSPSWGGGCMCRQGQACFLLLCPSLSR